MFVGRERHIFLGNIEVYVVQIFYVMYSRCEIPKTHMPLLLIQEAQLIGDSRSI